jgi:hypothetical protein
LVYCVAWPAASPVCPLGEVRPGRWSVSVDAGSVFVLTWAFHAESAERCAEFAEFAEKGFRRRSLCGSAPNSSLRILRTAQRSLREKRTISRHRRGHAKAISAPSRPACWIDLSSGRTNGTYPSPHRVAAALAHTGMRITPLPTPKPPFQTKTITTPTQDQLPQIRNGTTAQYRHAGAAVFHALYPAGTGTIPRPVTMTDSRWQAPTSAPDLKGHRPK